MILHTPVPMDLVFPAAPPKQAAAEREGRYFSGISTGEGLRITRLCSTCPADYLRADWQPGCLLPAEETQSVPSPGRSPRA